MTITDTHAQAIADRPARTRQPWWVVFSGCALIAAAVWFAGASITSAIEQSAEDQVQVVIDHFNQGVENDNAGAAARGALLSRMSDSCFDDDIVNGAMQQNGCFLQFIAQILGGP